MEAYNWIRFPNRENREGTLRRAAPSMRSTQLMPAPREGIAVRARVFWQAKLES
jgi:hypothetical protein